MKKRIISVAVLAAIVLMGLTSCCVTSEENSTEEHVPLHLYSNVTGKIRLFVDPKTKVNYLFYDNGSMVVRVDKEGKPVVGYPDEGKSLSQSDKSGIMPSPIFI